MCECQTKVYSFPFWILSIFCCKEKNIKSNKLFLRNQYLVYHIMCSRTRCITYFAFKFLWLNFKYILFCPGLLRWTNFVLSSFFPPKQTLCHRSIFFSVAWQIFSSWKWLSSVDLQITYEINVEVGSLNNLNKVVCIFVYAVVSPSHVKLGIF